MIDYSIVIVGGGLGGRFLALALQQRGINAQILEASENLEGCQVNSKGTALSIWPNAFQALSLVEPRLKQQINSIGAVITRTIVYSSSGEPPKENNRLGLLTMIRWDRLLEILDSYLPPDSIHYQHQVVGIEPGVDRVTVHLKDKPSLTSKFLVAADGLWSKIRPIILSEHPKNLHKPRFEGQGFWVGLLPPGSQASQLACQLCPTGEGRLFDKGVVFLFDCGENFRYWRIRLPLSILKEYDPKWDSFVNKHSQGIRTTHGGSEIKERLLILSKARKWPSELHEFFTAIDENLICERGIFVHNVAPRWSLPGFNIVLLGDAAHATSPIGGQGGAMAFEDGAILASLLGKIFSNSQIPDSQQYQSVIASYEKQRMHRATLVQMLNNVQGRRSFFGGQDESAPEANHPLVKEWLAKPQAYRQWQQTFLFDANC